MQDVSLSTISGGISNRIVKVTPLVPGIAPVAFKIFGNKTELLVDREEELKTLIALNASGFAAQASPTDLFHLQCEMFRHSI